MEELSTIFNNVGLLVAAIAGGISLVMFGFAGIQYMTAQGDPQGMSRAKMSVIGAVVGLAIAGLAFVMPGVISRLIIEPAGGQGIASDAGADCDQLLRNQFVFQRGASTSGRMNEVIRQIQSQRDDCVSELWNPSSVDATAGSPGTPAQPGPDGVLGTADDIPAVPGASASHPNCVSPIGGQSVPRGLAPGGITRLESGRDSANNIIIYFHATDNSRRPADASSCWMFVSRLNTWAEAP